MEKNIKHSKEQSLIIILALLFLGLTIWWACLNFLNLGIAIDSNKQIFAASYQILALFGGITGLIMTRRWGGHRSLLGRALIFLSLGLLLQSFGQSSYSFYIFFKQIEIPYPSIGDIGFFGSVIAYIFGVINLARVSGFKFSWESLQNKLQIVIIPAALLMMSYFMFLRGYEFDFSEKLKIFLDFGYPLGQALYVSIAVLTLVVSRNMLGGIMKKPIIFLIIALIVQYLADFMFLYQANAGTWSVGGINDYLYAVSYFFMALSLIYIGHTFNTFQEGRSPEGGIIDTNTA